MYTILNMTPITMKYLTLALYFLISCKLVASEPVYDVVHEHAELLSYAKNYGKDVEFNVFKLNNSNFALNVSFFTLRAIPPDSIKVKVAVDKLYGTEYKRTGTSLSMGACQFSRKNVFGICSQLLQHGNMDVCNIQKSKKYYLYNFTPETKLLPKYLPYGSYRVLIELSTENEYELFRLHWFARVQKRVNWS